MFVKALVVGCGRLGSELANQLYLKGHEVTVIDANQDAFANLAPDFRGKFEEGDALNRDVLHRAGIEEVDSVAVVTSSDILNAVVGSLAKDHFHVPNVVVRNYSPGYRHIHESYGLQVISALGWGARRIEEMMYHQDVRPVFSAGNGEVEVYELSVPTSCAGKTLSELVSDPQLIPVAVTRAGKAMLPQADLLLETGDLVHISTTLEGIEKLRHHFNLRKQEQACS